MTIPTLSPSSEFTNVPNSDSGPFDLAKIAAGDKDQANKLVAWVNSEYTKIRTARFRIEQQWYANLAFYLGKQNVVTQITNTPMMTVGRLAVPSAPPWRARPVVNKVRQYVRKEHSKLTAQKPTAYILPATADDDDIFAAQAGEQIWESLYESKKISRIVSKAVWWQVWTGNGFVKSWWDDKVIDKVSDQQGDICVEALTPFHVLVPDFIEEDIERQAYVMHISTKDIDWVKLNYPTTISGKPIKPNVNAGNEILDSAFINLINANNLQNNSVLVIELWVKPGMHRLFPDGGLITFAGNDIVQAFPGFPYEHDQYPFTKLDHIAAGKFYCDSSIVDLIPLQREYNRTHGQIIEAKNRMAKPQLVAPKGSVDPKKITTEPGQVIEYKPGFAPPAPLPLQNLPQYVMEHMTKVQQDMDDIVGQHDVSSGQVPPGVTAATAISYLQEADDSILQDSLRSLETGYEKLGSQVLSLCAQYWDVPRTIKVTGMEGSFDVLMFSQEDLKNNTDLRIQAGSALPLSKAGRTATVMDLMKMGWVSPEQGLELIEIGGAQKFYEEIQVDVRQAQRENVRMQRTDPQELQQQAMMQQQSAMPGMETPDQGMLPGMDEEDQGIELGQPLAIPVNSWDNHEMHINVHNRFRKSQGFEVLDDAIKELFEEHVNMHMAAIQQQMMTQPQMNGPEQPAPEGSVPDNGTEAPTQMPAPQEGMPPNG